jgi:tyrosine-protein phosphatase YwqE
MFNFFSRSKSSKEKADYSMLRADMHSHLLPGIDDGAPDMENSLHLIRGMMDLGFSKLITTPHIMWDMYQNTREIVLAKLAEVKGAVLANGLNVTIHAGAEYFVDEHVELLLKRNASFLTVSGPMVLVEFSMAYPSQGLKDVLFDMQMQGYQPIIAHPERYIYLERTKDFYDELKDIGCLFQLNLLSLTNYYGKAPHELAQYLIKKGYYDLVGTDLHGQRHLDALNNPSLVNHVKKLMDTGKIRNPDL